MSASECERKAFPKTAQSLTSFFCFVNYLRKYMDPEWIKHETVLISLRKKTTDLSILNKDVKYENAFKEIRKMLLHCGFRPDYGWSVVLCQRARPHAAPKIICIHAKAFSDTQLRWSAVKRDLYAMWQGVTTLERHIRGFKVYVCMDHKE